MRYTARSTAIGLIAGGLSGVTSAHAQLSITYRNLIELPASVSDQHGGPMDVDGLSGLTALPDGRFVAVMDNSNKLLFFRPAFAADGTLTGVTQVQGLTMSQSRDFEDLALIPQSGTALLCDEGASGPLSLVDLATGMVSGGPAAPSVFANVRTNFGMEGVTVSPDGQTAWACNEEALSVDGGLSTASAGTRVRLQRFTRQNGAVGGFVASGQWCYITQTMHGPAVTGSRSGVSALVALPGGGLLAVERSFAFNGAGFFLTRMYEVSTAGATETSAVSALAGVVLTPCIKTTRYGGYHANLEGVALGSALAGGGRAMLGIVDNGDPLSGNRVLAFEVRGLPSAGCGPADVGGQGGVSQPDGLLDNNDFIAFINAFFGQTPTADLGRQGGVGPGDGLFNNNDFVVFIDLFFDGCT